MTANNDSSVGGHVTGIGATRRTDSWWISPAIVVAFIGVAKSPLYALNGPLEVIALHTAAVSAVDR